MPISLALSVAHFLNISEEEHSLLENIQITSTVQSIKELEDLTNYETLAPVCQKQEQSITECLRFNVKQPLKCGDQVKEFYDCVNLARLNCIT